MVRQMKKRKGITRKRKAARTDVTRRQIGKGEEKDEPASAPEEAGC